MSDQASPYRAPEQPSVPDHRGERQPAAVYWTPADPRIGPLVSAWSNQDRNGLRPLHNRRRQLVIAGVLCGGFGALLAAGIFSAFGALAGLAVAGAVAAALIAMVVFGFRTRPWCNYIGEEGMSDHRMLSRGPKNRILRFADATGFFVARTDHIENGFYRHTITEKSWRDAAGGVLLSEKLMSVERGVAAAGARLGARMAGRASEDPMRTWLAAGEKRWSELRRARADAEIAEHGTASFPLTGGGTLIVRRGAIEVTRPKGQQTLAATDAGATSWKEGVLTIERRGGKSKEALRLAAGEVGDLAIALAFIRDVAGIGVDIPA
jgi:hypothetical protein